MEYSEINNIQPIKANFNHKSVHKHFLSLGVSSVLFWSSISLGIDDDMLIILPFIILPFVIGLLVSHFATLNLQLNVFPDRVKGTHLFNKNFDLLVNDIQKVKPYGNNGIKIICKFGRTYNFSYITNRDDVCTAMANIGISLDPSLIDNVNPIITSELDIKKHKSFEKLFVILTWVGNLFLTISAIWYKSPDNLYYHETTEYFYYGGYKIPYESGYWTHSYEIGEMFTTYIAIACFIAVIVLLIRYLTMANNRVSVSSLMVRGVNAFGKVTIIPTIQITAANINAKNSMLSINQMGKVYKFYWLMNNTQLCAAISDIKAKQATVAQVNNVNTITNVVTNNTDAEKKTNMVDIAEELRALKELLDSGIISPEDFEAKKKHLLNL